MVWSDPLWLHVCQMRHQNRVQKGDQPQGKPGGQSLFASHPFKLTLPGFKSLATGVIRAANFPTALHIDLDTFRHTFHALTVNTIRHTTHYIWWHRFHLHLTWLLQLVLQNCRFQLDVLEYNWEVAKIPISNTPKIEWNFSYFPLQKNPTNNTRGRFCCFKKFC